MIYLIQNDQHIKAEAIPDDGALAPVRSLHSAADTPPAGINDSALGERLEEVTAVHGVLYILPELCPLLHKLLQLIHTLLPVVERVIKALTPLCPLFKSL